MPAQREVAGKLHSLEHNEQKSILNTAWKVETWFKVKKKAGPPKPPIAAQTTPNQALPPSNQQ